MKPRGEGKRPPDGDRPDLSIFRQNRARRQGQAFGRPAAGQRSKRAFYRFGFASFPRNPPMAPVTAELNGPKAITQPGTSLR